VSNLDGTHQFSQSLAEHNQAISRAHQRRKELADRVEAQSGR
jgi:hypothetical protein